MIDVTRLRKSLQEPQAAFAKRFGVNQSTVSRWEEGEEPSGPALVLLKLLEAERAETVGDGSPPTKEASKDAAA